MRAASLVSYVRPAAFVSCQMSQRPTSQAMYQTMSTPSQTPNWVLTQKCEGLKSNPLTW